MYLTRRTVNTFPLISSPLHKHTKYFYFIAAGVLHSTYPQCDHVAKRETCSAKPAAVADQEATTCAIAPTKSMAPSAIPCTHGSPAVIVGSMRPKAMLASTHSVGPKDQDAGMTTRPNSERPGGGVRSATLTYANMNTRKTGVSSMIVNWTSSLYGTRTSPQITTAFAMRLPRRDSTLGRHRSRSGHPLADVAVRVVPVALNAGAREIAHIPEQRAEQRLELLL